MDRRRRGPGCAAWLLLALILLGAVGAGLGWIYVKRYMPTYELADKSRIFGVSGDETALILNNELQDETGLYSDGQVYLPIDWVNEHLNQRFYWDAGEELLVRVMQDSVSVDPETHKLLRPKVFFSYGVFEDTRTPREERNVRIAEHPELPEIGRRTIRYSDIDYNRHLNNAVYPDIAMDVVPDAWRERPYTGMQIDYVSEALLGEELTLRGGETENGYLVQGYHARGLSFSMLLR